jgi:hypothetical protein
VRTLDSAEKRKPIGWAATEKVVDSYGIDRAVGKVESILKPLVSEAIY